MVDGCKWRSGNSSNEHINTFTPTYVFIILEETIFEHNISLKIGLNWIWILFYLN